MSHFVVRGPACGLGKPGKDFVVAQSAAPSDFVAALIDELLLYRMSSKDPLKDAESRKMDGNGPKPIGLFRLPI